MYQVVRGDYCLIGNVSDSHKQVLYVTFKNFVIEFFQ